MSFRDDERAQAIQIGAVLLFATLVIAFSLYQAFVVPSQNEQIELDHNIEVQQQLQDLRNAIVSTPGQTSGTGTTVSLGTSYPARIIALNPAPPSGRLTTDGTTDPRVNLTITNATAAGETGDVWNGSTRAYNSGGIVYEPNYNRYRDPPTTIYENTLLYNSFESGDLTLAGQSLISGNRISLVALNGSFSRSSSTSTTVDTRPISSSDRTVLVSGDAITLNLTTRLSVSRWETLLDGEENVDTVTPAPNADAVPEPFTRVQITLDSGQYRLQMAKVGVGTGASEEPAEYLTDIEGTEQEITQGQRHQIILEVRDKYNNPESGVRVNGSVAPGSDGSLVTNEEIADSGGQVRFTYNTTGSTVAGTHQILFTLNNTSRLAAPFSSEGGENVSINVTVTQGGVGGSNLSYQIDWTDLTTVPGLTGGFAEDCTTLPCNITMQAETIPPHPGAPIGFESTDSNIASLSEQFEVADPSGSVRTTVQFQQTEGNATLWTVSGNTNDTRIVSTPGYESFETDFGRYGAFGTFQGPDPERVNGPSNSGSYSVALNGGNDGGIVTTAYDTRDAESVIVQYWVQENDEGEANELGEDLVVEYLNGSGNWTEFDRFPSENPNDGQNRMARLGTDAIHANFSLRFRQEAADNANDEWLIDDPQITVIGKRVAGGEPGGRSLGGGGGGQAAADIVEYVTDSATDPNNDGGVVFSLENVGSNSATITEVSVSTRGNSVTEIYESNLNRAEMVFDGSDIGYLETGNDGTAYSLGTSVPLSEQATLNGGTTMDIYMYYFQKNGNQKDMSGKQITVDLTFADGSVGRYSFSPS